jgi:hypothetical protein
MLQPGVKPLDIMMEKPKRTLKGFNPYRVGAGVVFEHTPRVTPLAVEFLPFREKQYKSTNETRRRG